MTSKIFWAVLVTALTALGMEKNSNSPHKLSDENTKSLPQKLPNFLVYKDKEDEADNWIDSDAAEKLSRLTTQATPPTPKQLIHLVDRLKHRPDSTGYDSDEIPAILNRFDNPTQEKK